MLAGLSGCCCWQISAAVVRVEIPGQALRWRMDIPPSHAAMRIKVQPIPSPPGHSAQEPRAGIVRDAWGLVKEKVVLRKRRKNERIGHSILSMADEVKLEEP